MDPSAALTATIENLYVSVGLDPAVTSPLAGLTRDLKIAVPSYLGLRLTFADHHHPINLTSFAPHVWRGDVGASMRLPLYVLKADFTAIDPESTITFYAGNPGAFVDLAADLAFGFRRPGPIPHSRSFSEILDQSPAPIALDDDLRPDTAASGVTGAEELAVINRAVGLLIGGGHDPDDAHHELNRRAAAAGVDGAAFALELVRPTTHY